MNISSTSSLHVLTSGFSSYDMNGKPEIDYSLYLVTARELLPPGKVSLPPADGAHIPTADGVTKRRTTMKALKRYRRSLEGRILPVG
jgi:hypothetical protein